MEVLKKEHRRHEVLDILLALYEGPKHVEKLLSAVGGSATTLESKLQLLIKERLVCDEMSGSWPYKRIMKLTGKGRRLMNRSKFATILHGNPMLSERDKVLLGLLHAMGGEVKGKTRLEKLPFLLGHEFNVTLTDFDYKAFPIGPFSKDLLTDVAWLVMLGLIDVEDELVKPMEKDEEVVRTTYRLTQRGKESARRIFDHFPEDMREALRELRRFNEMPLPRLLDYVHQNYPEFLRPE